MFAIGQVVSADRLNAETALTKVQTPLIVRQVRGELVRALDRFQQPVWVHIGWLDPINDDGDGNGNVCRAA